MLNRIIWVCALVLTAQSAKASDTPHKNPRAHMGMTIGIPSQNGEFYDGDWNNRTSVWIVSLNGDLFLTRQVAVGVSSAVDWTWGEENELSGRRIGPKLTLFPNLGSAKTYPYLSAAFRIGSLTGDYVEYENTFSNDYEVQEFCFNAGIAILISKPMTLVFEIGYVSQELTHDYLDEKLTGSSIGLRVGVGALSFGRRGF